MPASLERALNFVWENARLIDRARLNYLLLGKSPARIFSALRSYQNDDGSFGHALEPDVRAPDSQPLFIEEGFRILYSCGLRDGELASRACDFLAQHVDLQQGAPTLFDSSMNYPHAPHWNNPASRQPSIDRLTSLIGLLNWQQIDHPWLAKAVEVCLNNLEEADFDAHTLRNAFTLLESVPNRPETPALWDRLAARLPGAAYFIAEAPVREYGLTPLEFALRPDSPCRNLFRDDQIEAHLDDLEAGQAADGGWQIAWTPPSEGARWEWRGEKTVQALATLRAYGRI